MLDKEYEYELNRIEYTKIVYKVNQYDKNIIYSATFPTKEKAEKHLKEITIQHKYYNYKIIRRKIPIDSKYALVFCNNLLLNNK